MYVTEPQIIAVEITDRTVGCRLSLPEPQIIAVEITDRTNGCRLSLPKLCICTLPSYKLKRLR